MNRDKFIEKVLDVAMIRLEGCKVHTRDQCEIVVEEILFIAEEFGMLPPKNKTIVARNLQICSPLPPGTIYYHRWDEE